MQTRPHWPLAVQLCHWPLAVHHGDAGRVAVVGVRSQWILHNGPDPMTERQLGCLFTMMESWEPSNLVREVPEEECRSLTAYGAGYHDPSSRSLTAEERWGLIRDLCQKHRGEVREINGSWRFQWHTYPTEDRYLHAQY